MYATINVTKIQLDKLKATPRYIAKIVIISIYLDENYQH